MSCSTPVTPECFIPYHVCDQPKLNFTLAQKKILSGTIVTFASIRCTRDWLLMRRQRGPCDRGLGYELGTSQYHILGMKRLFRSALIYMWTQTTTVKHWIKIGMGMVLCQIVCKTLLWLMRWYSCTNLYWWGWNPSFWLLVTVKVTRKHGLWSVLSDWYIPIHHFASGFQWLWQCPRSKWRWWKKGHCSLHTYSVGCLFQSISDFQDSSFLPLAVHRTAFPQ